MHTMTLTRAEIRFLLSCGERLGMSKAIAIARGTPTTAADAAELALDIRETAIDAQAQAIALEYIAEAIR